MARKGARLVTSYDDGRWKGDAKGRGATVDRPEWEPEVWLEDEAETAAPTGGPPPSTTRRRPAAAVPEDVRTELADAVGRTRAERVQHRLSEAIKAYERDRYADALRTLRPLAQSAPLSATVRELHGLTLYRLGRWLPAIKELEAFHAITASYDQHPVLADCHRALRHWKDAERVWDELRRASPPAELLAEGRIVMAGVLADQGDLAAAIALLEQAKTKERPPPLHHLRTWYALADLYERAGDVPRTRALFAAVLDADPTLFDTADRLAALA